MISPPIGLSHKSMITVDETLIVPSLPPVLTAIADMPPVLATAYMVAFVEATCIEALAPYLETGEATVGTSVNIGHTAATPTGLSIAAEVELIAVENRKLLFRVRCTDEIDCIGEGLHERALIDRHRFDIKLNAKKGLKMSMP